MFPGERAPSQPPDRDDHSAPQSLMARPMVPLVVLSCFAFITSIIRSIAAALRRIRWDGSLSPTVRLCRSINRLTVRVASGERVRARSILGRDVQLRHSSPSLPAGLTKRAGSPTTSAAVEHQRSSVGWTSTSESRGKGARWHAPSGVFRDNAHVGFLLRLSTRTTHASSRTSRAKLRAGERCWTIGGYPLKVFVSGTEDS